MTLPLLAIDPGTTQSGWCLLRNQCVPSFGVQENISLLHSLSTITSCELVIEEFVSYGMPIGKSCLDTIMFTGRLIDRWCESHTSKPLLIPRSKVKLHLCGSVRAKDGNVRQALIDRYGGSKAAAVGVKKSPGPLYGCHGDAWSALALAVTYLDTHEGQHE